MQTTSKTQTANQAKIHRMTVAAMLSAIAFLLQFLEFSTPIIPAFVKFDFSDLPALLGAYALGPMYGVIIELVKNLLHLPFGSSAGVGEIANFVFGTAFTFTAGIVYKHNKSRKGAMLGAVLGALTMTIVTLPINYFIVYPAYVKIYGMPLEVIVSMYQAILGSVAEIPTTNALLNCLLIFNMPFTFMKGIIVALISFVIYKPLSPILHGAAANKK